MAYNKTTWENLPSTNTPINANNLNNIETELANIETELANIETELANKNIITVGLTSDITISSAQAGKDTQIELNKVIAKVGNKLSLSGGKIVVGAGVSHVLVSASCNMWLLTSNGNAKNFFVYHNNSGIIASVNTVERTSKINNQKSLPMQLVSVSEGDTFAFGVYAGTGDVVQSNGARTYVTVQVVD